MLYYIAELLLLPTILFALIAQFLISSRFRTYSKQSTQSNLSGEEAAKKILQFSNITTVAIKEHHGLLSDHYNPLTKTLQLSTKVFHNRSIAAIGVAAHEAGHAIQHQQAYFFLMFRSTLVPSAQLASWLAFPLIFLGFALEILNLVYLGIFVFSLSVVFSLVTLPVEFDASKRALHLLQKTNILTEQELAGVKKILSAAALTYVAAAIVAILQLVRFLGLAQRKR